jgi:hypothetical protein
MVEFSGQIGIAIVKVGFLWFNSMGWIDG